MLPLLLLLGSLLGGVAGYLVFDFLSDGLEPGLEGMWDVLADLVLIFVLGFGGDSEHVVPDFRPPTFLHRDLGPELANLLHGGAEVHD